MASTAAALPRPAGVSPVLVGVACFIPKPDGVVRGKGLNELDPATELPALERATAAGTGYGGQCWGGR